MTATDLLDDATQTIDDTHPQHRRRGPFNAWFFDRFDRYINVVTRFHKQSAFDGMRPGRIVEIGAGTGANSEFLPSGSSVSLIEPNPAMHSRLRRRAERTIRRRFSPRSGAFSGPAVRFASSNTSPRTRCHHADGSRRCSRFRGAGCSRVATFAATPPRCFRRPGSSRSTSVTADSGAQRSSRSTRPSGVSRPHDDRHPDAYSRPSPTRLTCIASPAQVARFGVSGRARFSGFLSVLARSAIGRACPGSRSDRGATAPQGPPLTGLAGSGCWRRRGKAGSVTCRCSCPPPSAAGRCGGDGVVVLLAGERVERGTGWQVEGLGNQAYLGADLCRGPVT